MKCDLREVIGIRTRLYEPDRFSLHSLRRSPNAGGTSRLGFIRCKWLQGWTLATKVRMVPKKAAFWKRSVAA